MSKWKRALWVPTLSRLCVCTAVVTCSGLSPGGTHAYSSEAQPESSSEMECLWKSDTSFVIIFSSWPGTERTACSSRTHLQCTQIFLWRQGKALGFIPEDICFADLQHKPKLGAPGASGAKVQTTALQFELHISRSPCFPVAIDNAEIQRKYTKHSKFC